MSKDDLKQDRMKIHDLLTKGTVSAEDAERHLVLTSMIADRMRQRRSIRQASTSMFQAV